MKTQFQIIIFFVFLLAGCTSWKDTLVTRGSQNDAVHNAIADFLNSDKLRKKDTVFHVSIKSINNQTLGISIFGRSAKISPTEKNKIGSNDPNFPTQYLARDGKVFYWYDSTHTVSLELIAILSKYKLLDSAYVKGLIRYPDNGGYDDSKKAAHYYFCLCDLRKYVKIHTTIGMGYYRPPELHCDCK